MKKKSISMFCAALLVGSLTFGSASAKVVGTSNQKVSSKSMVVKFLFQHKEITDINELHQRAVNGISDISLKYLPNSSIKLTSTNSSQGSTPQLQTKTYSTAQILDETQNSSGTTENIAITSFADVVPTAATSNTLSSNSGPTLTALGTGSESDSFTDPTYVVEEYSTVNVSLSTYGGVQTYKLTSASGGWRVLDTSWTCTNRNALIGESGIAVPSGLGYAKSVSYNNMSSSTFSFSAPSNWVYLTRTAYSKIGTTQTCVMHRGSSSFSVSWQNHY